MDEALCWRAVRRVYGGGRKVWRGGGVDVRCGGVEVALD